MRNKNIKKLVSVLLCIAVMLSSVPVVNAAAIPAKYNDYVKDGRVDYQDLHKYYFKGLDGNKDLVPPTASFTISVERNGEEVASGISDSGDILYAQVGDTLIITNTSTASPGNTLSKCDFQISDGTTIKQTTSLGSIVSIFNDNIDTNAEGVYNIYLNVMDNTSLNTEGWGNWDYRGSHRSPGTNPGGGTGNDFPGWWYYSKLTIDIRAPEYTLEEKHIDITTGETLYYEVHEDITENSYTTIERTNEFSEYDFIGSRAGYTWADIANGTTEDITTRTANFDSTHRVAFHYYYYQKSSPTPPPPGQATIAVYYKDELSGVALYPADVETVDYGTYIREALPAPENYTFNSSKTASPQEITVDAVNDYVEITFYYKPDPSLVNKPPVAVPKSATPVYAGEEFSITGSGSYDPDGSIVKYEWHIGNAEVVSGGGLHLNADGSITGSSGKIWFPDEDGYATLTLTVTDNNGLTDSDSIKVQVLPPKFNLMLDAIGKMKQNRKVTLTVNNSEVSKHYAFVSSEVRYMLTPLNSSLTYIKYNNTLSGLSKEILPKQPMLLKIEATAMIELKDGQYRQDLIDSGLSSLIPRYTQTTEKTFTIVQDQPPRATLAVPSEIIRNPADSNYGTFTITNTSTSPDGDTIGKSACLVIYDSNNDGNFNEEICYYSVNGSSWLTTGKTLSQIKASGFNIRSLTTTNTINYTYKTKDVGNYRFEFVVVENIPADDTLVEFLTDTDYKSDSTFE